MRIKVILFALILSTLVAFGQEMPLVYEVENTCEDCPAPYLPTFNELPAIEALPDPFEWSDGRGRISHFSDWSHRRAEIKAEIEHYEIGIKPDRPDSIEASYSDGVLTVNITVNGKTLTLTSSVDLPSGEGPFPAVIGMNSPNGSIPSNIFTSRNIARITYNHNQVTTYGSQQNSDPYYQLYPDLNVTNTGQYSAWAWGVSRIIDGLELVQNVLPIDLKHIAVSGCSYAGKMALFSGALDERITLTIAQESGGGGYTIWRFSETLGSVEKLGSTDHNWFKEGMWQFSGDNVSRLPEDHHELMAMVAPRALLVTGNPDYVWLADESGYIGSKAAKKVWEALGVPDRFGFSIVGGHFHCAVPNSQIPEIEAFVDKFLLGKDTVNSNVANTPYNTNLSPWITWDTPTLSNGTSFFGKTTLIYPPNLQKSLDTNITFTWNSVEEAEEYFFLLATDPTFNNIVESDSATDTVKIVNRLLEGVRYYWRVQVKSADGLGPWSNLSNFSTYIPLPDAPQFVFAAITLPTRSDYITIKWNKVINATQYLIHVSTEQTFNNLLTSTSTSDTSKNIQGTEEGQKYYFRVQSINVEGSSPWSKVSNFTPILAPQDLSLRNSAINEITLSWDDNSKVEDGYIVERKQNIETSFTLLDTLEENLEEYIDKNVEQSQTYTYRVKAYKDSTESDYSNEATLSLTGFMEELGIPTEYSISQNYPNPFNPSTKIIFGFPKMTLTKIVIYDLIGREIRTLVNKELEAGYHEININANTFPSGVYFYRIQAGDFVRTKKMILMR